MSEKSGTYSAKQAAITGTPVFPAVRHEDHPAAAASALKPCPFCGSLVGTLSDDGSQAWVRCDACHMTGPLCHSAIGAVVTWNTRAAASGRDDELRELVDDLLDVLLQNVEVRMRLQGTKKDSEILAHWQPYEVAIRARLATLLDEA